VSAITLPPAARACNGLSEGERRRDQAHALLHARRPALIRRVQRAYLHHLLARGPATTDAVRELVPVPAGIDQRLVGAAVRALALDRQIVSVGRERSNRPAAHGRWLDRWSVIDRNAALSWLATHPDLPDPGPEATLCPDV
jgi:hypothetical protein